MLELRFAIVLLCFFLSGFAALLYQTVWTREFAFVFGTSEIAVATVLASYMAGLASGAAVAGRFAARIRRPVLVYAVLEGAIALCALSVPFVIGAVMRAYVAIFGGLDAPPSSGGIASTGFLLGASGLILLVPTALMGATLPLLAQHSVRRESEIGSRIGALYAVNTAGAIAGTLCAAFLLMPLFGLRQTVWLGAAVNGLVFVIAASLSGTAARSPAPRAAAASPRLARGARAWILPLMLLSGMASFSYEVLWTRLLGHLLGGSVYAFATMLASFLTGIAIGSAIAARLATNPDRAARGFAWAQLATAGLSLAAFLAMDLLPRVAASLGLMGSASPEAKALLAAAVLLPSALSIGCTFPFAVRTLARSEREAGPASAQVYAWNTIGAILGALGTGFFLLPALGYAGSATAAIALNLALAAAATALFHDHRRRVSIPALAGAAALALLPPSDPWTLLRISPLATTPVGGEIRYFAVGRSATVLLLDEQNGWSLRTNGLPEASIDREGTRSTTARTNHWLGALPVLARPETRSMLIVGLGGGTAVEAVPSSVHTVDVIELEPEVVAANAEVASERRIDPLADPRVRIHVNDARGALLLTGARFDAVVSQPSHPWTAGASHLYTRQFFSLVRDRLEPGGIFVQWIGSTFVDEPLLRTLVATLGDVFPYVRVYRPEVGSVLFLASDRPLPVEDDAVRALAATPADFARVGVRTPEDVAMALALDEAGARRFGQGARLNTDDRNLLAAESPRILGRSLGPGGADRILLPSSPLTRALPASVDRLALVQRLLHGRRTATAEAVAAAAEAPAERETARALVDLAKGRRTLAAQRLQHALQLDPTHEQARVVLAMLRRRQLEQADPAIRTSAAPLGDPAAAVFDGWQRAHAQDWDGLRGLEPRLALASPRSAVYLEALRLRAEWRIRVADAGSAQEAVALADEALQFRMPEDLVLRARAVAVAGDAHEALAGFAEAASIFESQRTGRRDLARRALDGLALVSARPELAAERAALHERLRRLAE